jgi:hypothetical protein
MRNSITCILHHYKSDQIKVYITGACRMNILDKRNACKILFRKRDRKRSLGRLRRRWEDNIELDLKEIGCELDSCGLG